MKIFSRIKKAIGKKMAECRAIIMRAYILALTGTSIITGKISIKALLADCRGENFVDSGLKILIAVVLGALLLAGLYALFGDTILPTLKTRVETLFNFNG